MTPTQTPSVDPDLYAVDIYQDDICLMALAGDRDVFVPEYGDSAGCRLRLFDFLPHSCKLASKHWFECRFGMVESDSSKSEICPQSFVHVAYLTSTMAQALGIAACQDRSSPRPYVERLVVRHEHRERPEFQQLVIELSCGLSQSHRGPVGLVAA